MKSEVSIGGLGFLGIILVVLKVAGASDLSWLWTLAPFWIPMIPVFLGLVVMCFAVIAFVWAAMIVIVTDFLKGN